jgi:hypothetical protein
MEENRINMEHTFMNLITVCLLITSRQTMAPSCSGLSLNNLSTPSFMEEWRIDDERLAEKWVIYRPLPIFCYIVTFLLKQRKYT